MFILCGIIGYSAPLRSDFEGAETIDMDSMLAVTLPPSCQAVNGENNEPSHRNGESVIQIGQLPNLDHEFTRSGQSLLVVFDASMDPCQFSPIQATPHDVNMSSVVAWEMANLGLTNNN